MDEYYVEEVGLEGYVKAGGGELDVMFEDVDCAVD